jgi:8-oxo-dGTP diphosphatase
VDLNLRQAVRALMIDPADRVLMVQLQFPDWTGWVLPGGGMEPGEDHLAALHRELAEETGVPQVFVGPALWRQRHVNPGMISGFDGQEELIFLVPCHRFEVTPGLAVEELRAEGVVRHRWWTVAELAAATEPIRPRDLHLLLGDVLRHGAPPSPIDLTEP